MLAIHDWANTGWRFSKCLEILGYNVTTMKRNSHKFIYPNQMNKSKILNEKKLIKKPLFKVYAPEILKYIKDNDVIHFISSSFVDTGADLTRKNVVVNHGGSIYRRNPEEVSAFFNGFINASLIHTPDLLNLGAKNEHLIYFPVDTNFIQPVFNKERKVLKIGHFPSSQNVKGTKSIYDTVKKFLKDFEYIGTKPKKNRKRVGTVNWEKNLERISDCDILIENLNLSLEKKKYGEWGNTAFEGAAMGKIVITNSLSVDVYKREYGKLPILIANNTNQIEKHLNMLSSMSSKEIIDLKSKTRQWVEDKHSLESTAKRLHKKIYRHF